jgi:predicted Rossmann fold nucleotide-binding protein DprA/Smf involved in DNA uptake
MSVANRVVKEHAIFTVFKFMLDELKDALLKRIKERQTVYSEVLHYLSNPSKPNDVINKSTKLTITKTLVELLRLNLNKDVEETILNCQRGD